MKNNTSRQLIIYYQLSCHVLRVVNLRASKEGLTLFRAGTEVRHSAVTGVFVDRDPRDRRRTSGVGTPHKKTHPSTVRVFAVTTHVVS